MCAFCVVPDHIATPSTGDGTDHSNSESLGEFVKFLDSEHCCKCPECDYCRGSVGKYVEHRRKCHEPISKRRRSVGLCAFCAPTCSHDGS